MSCQVNYYPAIGKSLATITVLGENLAEKYRNPIGRI